MVSNTHTPRRLERLDEQNNHLYRAYSVLAHRDNGKPLLYMDGRTEGQTDSSLLLKVHVAGFKEASW